MTPRITARPRAQKPRKPTASNLPRVMWFAPRWEICLTESEKLEATETQNGKVTVEPIKVIVLDLSPDSLAALQERVARAIYEASPYMQPNGWALATPEKKQLALMYARAALAAISRHLTPHAK